MNDNSRRNAQLVQQARDLKLTPAEIKALLAKRPTTYAPLRLLLPQGEIKVAYKPEVLVQGKWCQNGLAFPTQQEAERSASDLMYRWLAVQDSRAVEVVGLPANYTYTDGKLAAVITA